MINYLEQGTKKYSSIMESKYEKIKYESDTEYLELE